MARQAGKHEVITFKADEALLEAMKGVPNRSEFIRGAILDALDHACPLCRGTGVLTPAQRRHWRAFASHHSVAECESCHAVHLVCAADEPEAAAPGGVHR